MPAGKPEAQWCGLDLCSQSLAIMWAEAAPPLATAAARKGVLLTLRSALRLRLELP